MIPRHEAHPGFEGIAKTFRSLLEEQGSFNKASSSSEYTPAIQNLAAVPTALIAYSEWKIPCRRSVPYPALQENMSAFKQVSACTPFTWMGSGITEGLANWL